MPQPNPLTRPIERGVETCDEHRVVVDARELEEHVARGDEEQAEHTGTTGRGCTKNIAAVSATTM